MIDWFGLAANTLWILGMVVGLSTVSHASWEAAVSGEKLRARLGKPRMQIWHSLAGVLFCLGLAGTADARVEIVIWLVLAAAFLIQMVIAIRGKV